MILTINVVQRLPRKDFYAPAVSLPPQEAFQVDLSKNTFTDLSGIHAADVVAMYRNGDESDVVFVQVRHGHHWEAPDDGDWIVRCYDGSLELLYPDEFRARYKLASEEDTASLRARDINDPEVMQARRIAAAFSTALRDTSLSR